jgi:hypothetical protein
MSARLSTEREPLVSASLAVTFRPPSPIADGNVGSTERNGSAGVRPRLAKPLEIEHVYVPDREAMAAALRVALGLPRVLSHPAGGGKR